MPKPFDATLKDLIRAHPADWLRQLGVPLVEPIEVLSADLSTVTAAPDTLIRVGNPIIHIDVESGPDDSLASRMLLYNVLAHNLTGLPVRTVAVLLRSNARRANLTNRIEYEGLTFTFDILKVWEQPAEMFLNSGVGLLPLAVLGKPAGGMTRERALPGIVERILDRVQRESKDETGTLMTATYVLSGMHTERELAKSIFQRVMAMRESGTYMLILEEGAIEHARSLILKWGRKAAGAPTEKQVARLNAIEDIERLDRMAAKATVAKSWDSLLRTQ